jgi:hypothetical protein
VSRYRTAGYVSLGVGAAAGGVGVLGGLITMSAKKTADANCVGGCNADGLDAESRGKTWSAVSTVGFVAGAVGLGAGAALILLAPKNAASAVSARPLPGGAGLEWSALF